MTIKFIDRQKELERIETLNVDDTWTSLQKAGFKHTDDQRELRWAALIICHECGMRKSTLISTIC